MVTAAVLARRVKTLLAVVEMRRRHIVGCLRFWAEAHQKSDVKMSNAEARLAAEALAGSHG